MPDLPSEPDPLELQIIGTMGRLQRLVQEEGLTIDAAAAKIIGPESADEYVARNAKAMQSVEAYLLSPEYLAKVAAATNEPDPAKRAAMQADLKRENFARLDLQAVHRHIGARVKQMEAEGVIRPTSQRRSDHS